MDRLLRFMIVVGLTVLLPVGCGCGQAGGDDEDDDDSNDTTPSPEPDTPASTIQGSPTPTPSPTPEVPDPTPGCSWVGPFYVCNEIGRVVGDPPQLEVSGLAVVQEEGVTAQLCAWGGSVADPYQAFACTDDLEPPLAVNYPYYWEIDTGYEPDATNPAASTDVDWVMCFTEGDPPQPTCYP